MVTDETLRETVVKEKRKLFMRLWMIPWIALTSTLILIIIFQWVYFKSSNSPVVKTAPIAPIAPIEDSLLINETLKQFGQIESQTNKYTIHEFCIEAVKNGHGEFKADKEGKVSFSWKALPPSTESIISSQVQAQVNVKLKGLQETYKRNAIEVLENKRKETYTECLKEFEIGAVSNGVGKWISDIKGETEFRWKSIPEIVMEYTCTESNKIINTVKRELPFSYDNYKVARNVGIDIEWELIKRVSLSIEGVFWGNKDNDLKEKVKVEVSKSIHGMFDGFETLNKVDRRYNIK